MNKTRILYDSYLQQKKRKKREKEINKITMTWL